MRIGECRMEFGVQLWATVVLRFSVFFFLLCVDLRFGQLTNDREPLGTQIEKRKVVILRVYIGKRLAIHTA